MYKNMPGRPVLESSRLGFGCVQLTTHRKQAEAIATLECAFAMGITHFDVARVYGFGRAEGILAKFLRGKRQQVTVATKFGFQPPSGLAGNARLINTVKRALGPFPGLLKRAKQRGSAMVQSRVFDPEAAMLSLETSLRELGTDYVDVLLLHEATLADAASEELLNALQQQIAKGTVRHIGMASEFRNYRGDAKVLPQAYEVVQFNDNARSRNLVALAGRDERFLITHSIFEPAGLLMDIVKKHPDIASEASSRMNADVNDPEVINSLLLHYALRSNARGIVLFSSTNARHIEANAKAAESRPYSEVQLEGFVEFVDRALGAVQSPG